MSQCAKSTLWLLLPLGAPLKYFSTIREGEVKSFLKKVFWGWRTWNYRGSYDMVPTNFLKICGGRFLKRGVFRMGGICIFWWTMLYGRQNAFGVWEGSSRESTPSKLFPKSRMLLTNLGENLKSKTSMCMCMSMCLCQFRFKSWIYKSKQTTKDLIV